MASANERLMDEIIAHQVNLQAYSNGVVRKIVALLNRSDADLAAQLSAALERLDADSFTVERLEGMLASVRALNVQAYGQVEMELSEELRRFAAYEAGFQAQLFESVLPAQVAVRFVAVPADQVAAAAMSRPFQGRLLSGWASKIATDRMTRIREAIRLGVVEGQSIGDIVRRVRGTKAKGYSDGAIEMDRRHAEMMVRTAVSHVAAVARDEMYARNSDLIKGKVWLATLDGRTSEPCRLRDHKRYSMENKPIGHSYPWGAGAGRYHWGCRSTSTPLLASWRELGVDADEMDPGTRASMDGQVPAELGFGDWLRKQSAKRQDEILGPQRGALMRRGGLRLESFANNKGEWLTLEQLKTRESEAFKQAGLA